MSAPEPPPAIRSPLTREFVGVVAVAVLVVVGIHLLLVSSNRRILEGKLEDSKRVSAIVAAIVEKEMREDAPHRIQKHLEAIPLGEDLVAIRIFDHTGRLTYALGDDRIGRQVDRNTDPLCQDCHRGATAPTGISTRSPQGLPLFRVDLPIRNQPECAACHPSGSRYLGNLLLETTFTPMERRSMQRRAALLLAGGIAMLLAVLSLGLLLQVRILGPIRELSRQVQKVRSGDLEARLRVRREDEVGFLARSFNQMIDATRRHRDELEQMVEQRTAQLEQSRRQMAHRENLAALGRLAAGMAHEIGNPLSAISTLCQLVARRRREDRFVSEQLDLIETHVQRLTDLTARMMDLARPSSLDGILVDVNEVVESACKLAQMDRRLARRELRLELSSSLPRVPAHPEVLIQSMINLLLNAADASPEHSHITVTTAREGDRIVIGIRDEGGGIPPELEQAIFEPFFTTKPPDRGSGLGLSVSLSLLKSVGADLCLRNDPGRGATFVIILDAKGSQGPDVHPPHRG